MKQRINMITLGVSDMDRSVEFYESIGLERFPYEGDSPAFFALSGTWLALYPKDDLADDATVPSDGVGFCGITLAQNFTSKEEVDRAMDEARLAGAKVIKEPQDVFWGGYSGYFSDPDGYLWELAWNPFFWCGPIEEEEKPIVDGR